MRWFIAVLFLFAQTLTALASEEDKGLITNFLEETLSGLGREVQIEGFKGALSSRATMDKLTIADDEGVWLSITDAVLDWDRVAVLAGKININELAAQRIELLRLPKAQDGVTAEASDFQLPELPVSIDIASISAAEVVLSETIPGGPALVSVTGSLRLKDGTGQAHLAINRNDGPGGAFDVVASYTNETKILGVDVSLKEEAGGLVATLLKLPGLPQVELTVQGNAPIDQFAADIVLQSDGSERLRGRIESLAESIPGSDETTVESDKLRSIRVDLAGDLSPLFLTEHQEFFGPHVALLSDVSFHSDGRIVLEALTISAAALEVSGEVALAATGLPQMFDIRLKLASPDGDKVTLPFTGDDTRVGSADLQAYFNAEAGPDWSLTGTLTEVERAGSQFASVALTSQGSIFSGTTNRVLGQIDLVAEGISLADPAQALALGQSAAARTQFVWQTDAPLRLSDLQITADGLNVSGQAEISGFAADGTVSGSFQASVADLARLELLTNRPLRGQIQASLEGSYAMLGGAFDLELTGEGLDLAIGIPQVDANIKGTSRVTLSALRDTSGTLLRTAHISASGAEFSASGMVGAEAADLRFEGNLAETATVLAGFSGPSQVAGRAILAEGDWSLDLTASAPNQADLIAKVHLPKDGAPAFEFDLGFGDIAWFSPELSGPAQFVGTGALVDEAWTFTAKADGPGGSTFDLTGQVAADRSTADITAKGSVPLALANRRLTPNSLQGTAQIDLRLNGPLALTSVQGQITTRGAHLSLPTLRNALTAIDMEIILRAGTAEFGANADVAGGGAVVALGTVELVNGTATNVDITVDGVRITDSRLYDTTAFGGLRLSGAFPNRLTLDGQLFLEQLDIVVPTGSAASTNDIPDIRHLNASSAVRRTLTYAGLDAASKTGSSGPGNPIQLNVEVVAENRIFIRGRGLDAELGGQLRLAGSTADIIPEGRFELIRGRLDILGKRLDLEEGTARLQGQFVPTLRMVGSTSNDEYSLKIVLEGPALSPELKFESVPQLPEDEILSRFLFGKGLANISALQTVQMASALATLTGVGGEGVLEKLRRTTGVDDLDVSTNGDGAASVRIGKYINEKIYTDVQIDTQGRSVINLNLDVLPSTSLRGSVTSEGQTGVGIFFEKDY